MLCEPFFASGANVFKLETKEVSVLFDGLSALESVSLSLGQNEILGLLGPNGAGKTTLANVMSGYQPPTRGSLLLNNETVNGSRPEALARRGVARTFQSVRLFRRLTVFENVEVAALTRHLRRTGARALALEPRFLLLDEPAAGMTEPECDELAQLIQQLPEKFGCGVLLIEHNMSVVMTVCQALHVLNNGRTLAAGPIERVRRDPEVIAAYLGTA
jgi:branched-chain amino acid transport system ATP-binding protein